MLGDNPAASQKRRRAFHPPQSSRPGALSPGTPGPGGSPGSLGQAPWHSTPRPARWPAPCRTRSTWPCSCATLSGRCGRRTCRPRTPRTLPNEISVTKPLARRGQHQWPARPRVPVPAGNPCRGASPGHVHGRRPGRFAQAASPSRLEIGGRNNRTTTRARTGDFLPIVCNSSVKATLKGGSGPPSGGIGSVTSEAFTNCRWVRGLVMTPLAYPRLPAGGRRVWPGVGQRRGGADRRGLPGLVARLGALL